MTYKGDKPEDQCFVPTKKGGFPKGTLISLRLDMDQKKLRFGLNNKWNDFPSFRVPSGSYFPVVGLTAYNQSVSVMYFKQTESETDGAIEMKPSKLSKIISEKSENEID